MYTIATAGHIDHGKSALVKALTGTDPDRLPEEKRREMTIELGFASFKLEDGTEVGIIDVPGHERFIKTMIAGVGTLDLVLFIVAADDGWMPQTAEHLAILKHLGAKIGLIVLTKVDLAEPEWIELVKNDVRTRVADTFLAEAEILEFSAADNRNLDQIRTSLADALRQTTRPPLLDSARLFVDRSFTIAGTGTVVTGTLREGAFQVGQEVVHHPTGNKSKIKNLESFYSHLEEADPGIRLAIGLQAVERHDIGRGDLLYHPSSLRGGASLGVKLYLEPEQEKLVKHNRQVILLHGTSEVAGRLVLPPEPLSAEDRGLLALLYLEGEVVAKSGDRFILRLPTPSVLLGGGIVIDPLLKPFKRTFGAAWQLLLTAATLTPGALLAYELESKLLAKEGDLLKQALLQRSEVAPVVEQMLAAKEIIKRGEYLILKRIWDRLSEKVLSEVKEYHDQNPHLEAMPLASLHAALTCPEVLRDLLIESLISQEKLARFQAGVKLSSYTAGLGSELEQVKEQVISRMRSATTPAVSRKELFALHDKARDVYAFLKQRDQIVDIGGLVFLREVFDKLVESVVRLIKKEGKITVAQARDTTGSSRKIILPILEEMDRRQITRRSGDYRELVN